MSPASGSPAGAIEDFLKPLRLAANVVTQDRLVTCGYTPDELHTVTFGTDPSGLRLKSGSGGHVWLVFSHQFRVTDDGDFGWNVHSAGYMYTLADDHWHELVSYHWHPLSEVSPVQAPHMHTPAATKLVPLQKAHFPTGRVSFEAVLRFAIDELGVPSLVNDYAQRLAASEEEFRMRRTWS